MNDSVFVKNIDFEYENTKYTDAEFKIILPKTKKEDKQELHKF
jgi:hypothetical protein